MSTEGSHPRDFILIENQLIVANKDSNTLLSFDMNEKGLLTKMTDRIAAPEGVCILMEEMK